MGPGGPSSAVASWAVSSLHLVYRDAAGETEGVVEVSRSVRPGKAADKDLALEPLGLC